jgi:hypothetical protein
MSGGLFSLFREEEERRKKASHTHQDAKVTFETRFSEHDVARDGGFPVTITYITATLPDLEKKK